MIVMDTFMDVSVILIASDCGNEIQTTTELKSDDSFLRISIQRASSPTDYESLSSFIFARTFHESNSIRQTIHEAVYCSFESLSPSRHRSYLAK